MSDIPISPRRAETRQRLLDGAVGVFADRGVLAASVEEICDRAGFTRGAFYSNYASKNDLVLALLAQDRERQQAMVDGVASSEFVGRPVTSSQEIGVLVEHAVRRFVSRRRLDRDWVMVSAELRLYAAREPGIREAFLAHQQAARAELLQSALSIAERAGCEFTVPLDSVLQIFDDMYEGTLLQALLHHPELGDEERVQASLGPFIHVITSIVRPVGGRARA
ncbi:TetR/AcrR family transcriptional regulator [Raineyella sp. LH-20]|uniref:TetR/AcrR family transcriptional regulator n=1 Tax=Raineyella sp. LH-20 TaxID=3081204 RepID=UPI0029551AFD|nr:TetR/AcrR family transcriptional regulator [Raineyella sp. LH-20]WOP19505.1 TetR/AcrR family transcriptional regulator [Raineyella sp. LH-20]